MGENLRDNVYQKVLEVAGTVANNKTGGLFIIGNKADFEGKYRRLYPKLQITGTILDSGMSTLLEKFSELDGAILIAVTGELIDIGAMISETKPLPGFGTKHAAAAGITEAVNGSTAVLVPEHLEWIKVFKGGKVILEMDSEKRSVPFMKKVVSFVADNDTTLITTAGISAALLGLGPLLTVSGTYLVIKTATGLVQKNIKKLV